MTYSRRMANLVHNERIRLRAAWLNAASGTCFTVGAAAPTAAGIFYGIGPSVSLRALLVGAIFWLAFSAWLHWLARRALRGLIDV
jgi:hypothetical protein